MEQRTLSHMDEIVPLVNMDSERTCRIGRTAGCIGDPEVGVLDALKAGNLQLFCDLLTEEGGKVVDVNRTFEEEDDKTLLHVAVDKENVDALKFLLSARAKVNVVNRVLKTTPLHVAARKGNVEMFRLLLSHGADVNAVTSDGKTVLHILAKKCKSKREVDHLNCLKIAVRSPGCHVDKEEKSANLTPLMVAVKESSAFDVVRIFATAGADVTKSRKEICSVFGPESYEELQQSKSFDDAMLAVALDSGTAVKDELRRLLEEAETRNADNLREFEETLNMVPCFVDLMTSPPGEMSILQVAASHGLPNHLRLLLHVPNMNPNVTPVGTCPALLLTAMRGHAEALQVFKEHSLNNEKNSKVFVARFDAIDVNEGSSVLHLMLRKPAGDEKLVESADGDGGDAYQRCIQVLTVDLPRNSSVAREVGRVINAKDTLGNTALHYATQLWPQTVVRTLLEMGANIGMKNVYGEVPINHILPETMEAFLNESCLRAEGNVTNENFKITVGFQFLFPPRDAAEILQANGRGDGSEEIRNDAEIQKREAGEKEEDVYLPEADGLWYMGQSKKHQHLLKHPVVALFLWMKWKKMSGIYNRNLLVYAAFVACLTGYVFALYGGKSIRRQSFLTENCNKTRVVPSDGPAADANVLWFVVVALLTVLIGRELVQLGVAPKRYLFSVENWVEMALIVLTGILLFHDGYGCHVSQKRHVSAAVIVLSWSELITVVGRHPKLTTYNVYVTMFYRVLGTFIVFLMWYCLFIVAFALAFYILLHRDNPIDENSEYPFFDHVGLSLVKTFTMFVGELEFADLPITTPAGHLFLLAFVFLIVVVMMNLLNGLAVSDTGAIRKEAEIHVYKSQVEIISYLEAYMLGDPFNFLSNWPTFVWLRHLNCNLIGGLYKMPPVRKLFNALTNAKNVLLFVDERSSSVTFFPNRKSFRCSSCFCCGDEETDFPEGIMESAKEVVLTSRSREKEERRLEQRLAGVELALKELVEKLRK